MQDLSKVAIFNFVSRLAFTIIILIVIQKNEDYIWQPFLIGVIQTAVALWAFLWAYKKYNLKLTIVPFSRCMQVLVEERTIFFSLIFVNLYTTTNTVILGLYQNSAQVGYYTAAQRLIIIAQSVLTMPLSEAFYPFIGKAFGESREQGVKVTQKLIPLIIVYCGTASLLMLTLGPIAIKLFYGSKFDAAIPVFQILAVVPLLFALNNILGVQIMLNLGMDKYFLKITASAGILSIVLNFLMISKWGYMGTTFNWLVTEIFLFTSMYLVLRKQKINPINFQYFTVSLLQEYGEPIVNKILRRTSNVKSQID
jgi:O-antigen/teichoic acid export membrane protein